MILFRSSLKMHSNMSRDQREKSPNNLTFIFSTVLEEYINDVSKCTKKGPNRSSRASEEISTLSQNALRSVKRPKKKAPTISKLSPLELQKKFQECLKMYLDLPTVQNQKGPNNFTFISSRASKEISSVSQNVLRFANKPKMSQ